ncbi:MAG: DUF4271 domain-containing protein [Bacteroidales bacterium]|nr:DUF4271 domain-containing protein [Bacteroidales bacterium]
MQIPLTDTLFHTAATDSLSVGTDSLSMAADSLNGAVDDSLLSALPVEPSAPETIIHDAGEFFSGRLLLPTHGADTAITSLSWADSPINWGLITVFTILFILYLKRIVELLPYFVGGIGRWKAIVNLEDSMGRMRDRNGVAVIMIIPFCLACSYADLLPFKFLSGLSPGLRTAGAAGIFVGFFLLRAILIEIVGNGNASRDYFQISNRSAYDFFILGTLILILALGIMSFIGVDNGVMKRVSYYILGFFILVNMVRRTQILSNGCNQFTAILYLCALEILPLAILVAAAMIF